MSVKPSPEQELAIRTIDKNILVCASAGAGKTTVLIERLMKRIVVDKVSVSEILAMTFTEAAAGEMKRRLSKKLNEKYEETKDPFLYDQITLLASAQISTIHSFCLSVIRNYSYVLNLDPKRASNILDEATASLYRKEALDSVINAAYVEQPSDFGHLLEHFSSRPEADQGVREAILTLSVALDAKPDPEVWLDDAITAYSVLGTLANPKEPLRAYFFLHWQLKIEELGQYLKELDAADTIEFQNDEFTKSIRTLEVQLENAKQGFAAYDYTKIRRALFTMAENIPAAKGSSDVKAARKKVAVLLQELVPECFEEDLFLQDMSVLKGRLFRLGELTKQYRDAFAKIKEEQNCIDFDDMEHFALAILRDTKFNTKEAYKLQFKEILVDEFQDSNDVQDMLVELISRGNNVFRVGDIKQSIYRFRNAKPQIMQGLIQRKGAEDLLIYLKQNFRSDESIVEFNNLIFNEAMNVTGLRSSYLAEDAVSVGSAGQNGGAPVEIHWVLKEDDEPEEEIGEESEEEKDETIPPNVEIDEKPGESLKKARHIAADIIRRREASPYKNWRDYVILVRSHQLKNYLKKAFDEVNIPYFIDVQSGFYQADSVQDVLQFLHLCLEPDNEQMLVGTLLSPFFGFTQEKVAQIYLVKNRENLRSVFDRLYPEINVQLRAMQQLALSSPMHTFLPLIFDFNDYYATVCSHPQRTNLDLFLQKALSFEENNGNLPRFLELIEEIKDEKSSEAIPISLEDDVVRVMTIHQSKGLQFPVVYFWSSLRQNILDLTSELICDPDLGIALRSVMLPQRYVRKNPIRIAIETKAIQEEMEEQMRVLYVALTRPQNILVIVDTKPKTPFTSALTRSSVFSKIGYSGWLASVMYGKQSHLFVESDVSGSISDMKIPYVTTQTMSFTPLPHKTEAITYLTPSSQESSFAFDFTLRYRDPLEGKTRGTRLHSLIERLPTHDWSPASISAIDPSCTQDEIDSLLAFYASDFYVSARSVRIEKEFPFVLLEQDTVISGTIDMLAVYPDKVELMDFKADRSGTREQLIERYKGQLDAYAMALSKLFPGKMVYTFLYSLTLKQVIEVNHGGN